MRSVLVDALFPLKMSAPGRVSYKCGEVALLAFVGLSVILRLFGLLVPPVKEKTMMSLCLEGSVSLLLGVWDILKLCSWKLFQLGLFCLLEN